MTARVLASVLLLSVAVPISAYSQSSVVSSSSFTMDPTVVGDGLSVSATFDYWTNAKVDYGNYSWIDAGLFNINLTHPLLIRLTGALLGRDNDDDENKQTVLRIGGTLADHIVYDMTPPMSKKEKDNDDNDDGDRENRDYDNVDGVFDCVPIYANSSNIAKFSGGCLNYTRWQQVHAFAAATHCQLVFGINALFGGREYNAHTPWNSSNAELLIKASASLGYDRSTTLYAFELGNELDYNGGLAVLPPPEYAHMFAELAALVAQYYPDETTRPYLIGPDMMSGGDVNFAKQFLQLIAEQQTPLYAFTYHNYLTAGSDPSVDANFMNPVWLESQMNNFLSTTGSFMKGAGWASQLWMGETGGAYNSGRNTITNRFEGSFWYALELGLMSANNHSNHCRQALAGGNYGLIAVAGGNVAPNPDYYTALLYQQLVGGAPALQLTSTNSKNEQDVGVRAFAYCQRGSPNVALLALNFNRTLTVNVSVTLASGIVGSTAPRSEYHLDSDDLQSPVMQLNGKALVIGSDGSLPPLNPVDVMDPDQPIVLAPHSLAFVTFTQTKTTVCVQQQ